MANDFGFRIGIDGEKDYKNAIAEINQSFRVLGSEMTLVTSAFDANDKSAAALTARNNALNKNISEQTLKIETLRSALANASASFGENDKRTQDWQIKLNKANAELNDMERELQQNSDAMADADKKTDKLSKSLDNAGKSAKDSSGKFDGLKGVLSGMGAALSAVVVSAGAAAVALGKQVVESFGELEQNLGGSEAVFGEHAAKLQSISENAYKAMGTSQSEYLATANKMGALFQGSGLEQQRSMELTTQAMQRAADMASVMGIDTSAALEAITGAAKGNFTMMDNLGVAMNATNINAYALSHGFIAAGDGSAEAKVDMSKLADAQDKVATSALSVKSAQEKQSAAIEKYGADSTQAKQAAINLEKAQIALAAANRKVEEAMIPAEEEVGNWWKEASNAEKAEVAMQMFFENTAQYAGNFEREATQTVSGSIGLLQAAVSTLVAGLGNADADMVNLSGNVVNAFNAVVANVVPVIENIVTAIPPAVGTVVSSIGELLPTLLTTVTDLFSQVLTTIVMLIPRLVPTAVDAVMTIVETIITNLPLVINAATSIIASLLDGITKALPQLIPVAVEAVITIVNGLIEALPQLLTAGLEIILALVDGIVSAIPQLVAALPALVMSIVDFIVQSIPQIIEAGITLLTSLTTALPEIIAAITVALPQIIDSIINGYIDAVPLMIEAGVVLLTAIVTNLPQIIGAIVAAIPKIVTSIIGKLDELLPKLAEAGVKLYSSLGENLPEIFENLKKTVLEVVENIKSAFQSHWEEFKEVGLNLIKGLWQGISDAGEWLWDKISGFFGGVTDRIKDFFGIHSPSTVFTEIGKNLAAGLTLGIENGSESAATAAKNMAVATAEAVNAALGINSPSKIGYYQGDMYVQGILDALNAGEITLSEATDRLARRMIEGANAIHEAELRDYPIDEIMAMYVAFNSDAEMAKEQLLATTDIGKQLAEAKVALNDPTLIGGELKAAQNRVEMLQIDYDKVAASQAARISYETSLYNAANDSVGNYRVDNKFTSESARAFNSYDKYRMWMQEMEQSGYRVYRDVGNVFDLLMRDEKYRYLSWEELYGIMVQLFGEDEVRMNAVMLKEDFDRTASTSYYQNQKDLYKYGPYESRGVISPENAASMYADIERMYNANTTDSHNVSVGNITIVSPQMSPYQTQRSVLRGVREALAI